MQKAIIVFLFFVCLFSNTNAQTAPRYDTVMVAVFNTGAKCRIAPAEFGASTSTLFDAKRQFVGTLIAGNDTVHTWGTKNCDTCKFQKKQTTLTVSHGCNNIHGDIKDKVVIIDLGSCKDATRMALSAQKQGAKAVIFTHRNDNRDSLVLEKGAVGDSVTIPVFAVRNSTGAKMSAMLPSHIGIKEPNVLKNEQNLQNLTNDRNLSKVPDAVTKNTATEEKSDTIVKNVSVGAGLASAPNTNEMRFAPNPTDDLIYLRYRFDNPQTVQINITNAVGAIVFSGKLNTQSTAGEYEIDTKGWANGIYIATTTSNGIKMSAEKIVVQR